MTDKCTLTWQPYHSFVVKRTHRVRVWARNILWTALGGDSMVLTVWVCISSRFYRDVMNSIMTTKCACCSLSKTCGCPLCTNFVSRVRPLFHPVVPPHLDVQSSLKAKHRTLSKVSDPAPSGEAEVPDPPPSLFLTNGTLPLSFPWLMRDPHAVPLPAPYHLQFRGSLDPRQQMGTTSRVGPFDGSDMSSVVSDERLASLKKLSFSVSALLARDQKGCARYSYHLLRTPLWWDL